MPGPIFQIIFILSSLMVLFFSLYSPILKLLTRNKNLNKSEIKDYPDITITVPTYEEEENIKEKIENLLSLDYPQSKINIKIIDGGSSDDTLKIAKEFPVEIIDLKIRGKIKAINKAIESSSTRYIIFTDADVMLDDNVIKESLKYLNNDVKAVGCKGKFQNSENNFYNASKLEYHIEDWNTRYRESLLDSCCSLDGKFILLDKEAIDNISESAFTDDLELTIRLNEMGYRSIIMDDICFKEKMEDNMINDINKMRRRCKLSIANSLKNLDILFKGKNGYSKLILPSRRLFNFFTPFFLLIISLYLLFNFPIILLGLLSLNLIISSLKKSFFYYNILLISLCLAWCDILTGNIKKGCKWDY